MTAVPENILQKIRKLLTLGQSENASEAANAMGAAQKLMDEHRLTSAEIPGDKHNEAFHIDEANPLVMGGKLTFWKNLLLAGIMGENGCTWYMHRTWNRDRVVPGRGLGGNELLIVLVGRPSDVAIARYMYLFCESEVERLTKTHCKGRGARYAATFREACAAAIATRLRETHEADDGASNAVGLAVRSLAKRADEYMNATIEFEKSSHRGPLGVSERDPEARRAGARAGYEVEIHKALEEPAQAKAPALGSGA